MTEKAFFLYISKVGRAAIGWEEVLVRALPLCCTLSSSEGFYPCGPQFLHLINGTEDKISKLPFTSVILGHAFIFPNRLAHIEKKMKSN